MPRQPDVPGQPATNRVQVLLTDQDLDALDNLRDTTPTSTYLRDVIRTHIQRNTPPPADHEHIYNTQVATYTVMGKTTTTLRCIHCPAIAVYKDQP